MQACLILVGPAFMAASIYMILGRIILLTEGEHHALIKRRWLTKLFVTGDVISLLTQSAGTCLTFALVRQSLLTYLIRRRNHAHQR
jgi:hypothetical protein